MLLGILGASLSRNPLTGKRLFEQGKERQQQVAHKARLERSRIFMNGLSFN